MGLAVHLWARMLYLVGFPTQPLLLPSHPPNLSHLSSWLYNKMQSHPSPHVKPPHLPRAARPRRRVGLTLPHLFLPLGWFPLHTPPPAPPHLAYLVISTPMPHPYEGGHHHGGPNTVHICTARVLQAWNCTLWKARSSFQCIVIPQVHRVHSRSRRKPQ